MSTVLVVGATRILRPAAVALAASGHHVHAVARTESDLEELAAVDRAHLIPMPVDYASQAFITVLSHHRYDHALGYAPGLPAESWPMLRQCVDATSVLLCTSAAAQPAAEADEPFDMTSMAPPWHRLLLGWTSRPPRWHTPEEISAAALDVLWTGTDRVLGTVRPWTDRPSSA